MPYSSHDSPRSSRASTRSRLGRALLTALLIASSPATLLQAQPAPTTGTVSGQVLDVSGLPVPGALIQIEDTRLRALSNESGFFRIAGVTAGARTVVIDHIGYAPSRAGVMVEAGEVVSVDLTLEVSPIALGDVIVSGRRFSPAAALNDQRTSPQIMNVLSTEQAERFADNSLPDALRRIPGVAAELDRGEASTLFLRGLNPAFTTVTLDGQRLASTGLEDRSVNLAGLPIQMVEAVEVTKAITPDQDAEAVGGTINLRARTPRSRTARIQSSLSHHSLDGDLGGQVSGLYGNRFGALGILVDGSFQRISVPEDDLQHTWNFNTGGAPLLRRLRLTIRPVERTRINLGSTVDYRFSDQSSVYLRAFASRFDSDEERHRHQYRFDRSGANLTPDFAPEVRVVRQGRLERDRRDVLTVTAGGKHVLPSLNLDYSASLGHSERDEFRDYINLRADGFSYATDYSDPFNPVLTPQGGGDPYAPDAYRFMDYEIWHNRSQELDLSTQMNAEFPFVRGDLSGAFKVGGKVSSRAKDREYDESHWDPAGDRRFMDAFSTPQPYRNVVNGRLRMGTLTDWSRAPGFVADRFAAGELEFDVDEYHINSDPDDYEATETISAAYGMTTVNVGNLTLLGGLRYEYTSATYEGNELVLDENGGYVSTRPLSNATSYGSLFPMAHLRYAVDDLTNFRLAVTSSLARPRFTDLAPFEVIDRDNERISRGNPNLAPARAWNVDLLAERYFASVGVVSGGVFLKRISDFQFNTRETIDGGEFDGWEIRQPQSGEDITIYGAEIAWQQRLLFLPGALAGLGVYSNYTLSVGETDFESLGGRTMPLPGQSRHVANVGLSYELAGFSATTSWNYRGAFLEDIGASDAEDRFWDGRGQIDIGLRQDLPQGARVFVNLQNLTNSREQRYFGTIGDTRFPNRGVYQVRQLQFGVSVTR